MSIVEQFVTEWNNTGLPKVKTFTPERVRKLKARMNEEFFRENWRDGLERAAGSKFLLGENDRQWKADVDWFLRPGTVVKVMEGKYDNRDAARLAADTPDWLIPPREIREARAKAVAA